jgi:microcystin degradation protein MlrC
MTRIAVASVLTECNQLGGSPIDMDWFQRYDLHIGEELLGIDTGVVGGALNILRPAAAQIVPLLSASTCPGGYITQSCYDELRRDLLQRLSAALPVDGVLMLLHGAAAAEKVDDVEGDLIGAVRDLVGPDIPIIVTLDLHAHVTQAMVSGASAMLAWETYPHRDAYSTGERGARLLLDTVAGRCRPVMAMAKVPVITAGVHGGTDGDGAFARLMRHAKSLEGSGGILSTSVLLVHPYLDQPDLGSGCLVVADGDREAALALADDLARRYWESRRELEPVVFTPTEAISKGLELEGGPVLLVETADCVGGGASGDSVATLKALLKLSDAAPRSLVPVVDPQAVVECGAVGEGAVVRLTLGHQLDPKWGDPLQVTGFVHTLAEGRFHYSGGIWNGVEGDMGPCAVVEIGNIQILITTHATYDWADEQFRALGLDPAAAKFIVVKNPMNYHIAYGDIATAIYVLDTPGPTPPTLKHCPFEHVERPYFPADEELELTEPVVLRGW